MADKTSLGSSDRDPGDEQTNAASTSSSPLSLPQTQYPRYQAPSLHCPGQKYPTYHPVSTEEIQVNIKQNVRSNKIKI